MSRRICKCDPARDLCAASQHDPDCGYYAPKLEPRLPPLPKEQPAPVPNDNPAVWDLVQLDMATRDRVGRARYGTPLQPHNGRDALRDAYEEALDLVVYMRQALFERDGK